MTVLRLNHLVGAAEEAEALGAYKTVPVRYFCSQGSGCLDEAALVYQAFAVSLLSISFISG